MAPLSCDRDVNNIVRKPEKILPSLQLSITVITPLTYYGNLARMSTTYTLELLNIITAELSLGATAPAMYIEPTVGRPPLEDKNSF